MQQNKSEIANDITQQKNVAERMILKGYAKKIVQIATRLTYPQITLIQSKLEQCGHICIPKQRTPRSSSSIIHNRTSKIEATLLMQLYKNIAALNIFREIDYVALERAHDMYLMIRYEIVKKEDPNSATLDITDAWCLSREIRSKVTTFQRCLSCKSSYLTSLTERTCIVCPFCRLEHDYKQMQNL